MPRLSVLLLTLGLSTSLFAQDGDRIADLSSKGARILRADNAGRLTPPSNEARPAIVSAFLGAHHDAATVATLVVDGEIPSVQGLVHLRFRQRVNGLDVYGTYVRATLTPAGEIVTLIENLASARNEPIPEQVSHRDALVSVLARQYPGLPIDLPEIGAVENTVVFARGSRFVEDPTVTRVAVPMVSGRLRVGYLVETWDGNNQLWHTVVAGNGRIVFEELRTANENDTYKIFTKDPIKTPQSIEPGPGSSGSAESPLGWVTLDRTTGNNVDAYLDRDNNNAADSNGRPVSSTQTFVYDWDGTQSPTTTTNQLVAVTNLFYLNNVLHDKLYRHGFNEAAGNFQTNNFGMGGLGNDPVNAEAQDGGGTNNANFATPNDGSRPRMQMYLWNTATPSRDGDLDSDIVYHEYGHGLTWRMIGNMSGPFAGAIGEGMSDTLAIYLNRNDVVAEYSKNNLLGIRRFPYTGYPNTYADVTGGSVHADGEIYAATMWRLLQLWEASDRTQDELFDYVIDGMNHTASRPAFEDMRDGILAAMPTAEEDCLVWEAFSEFGIGVGADGRESCFLNVCSISVTESTLMPTSCSSTGNLPPVVAITSPANGSSFSEAVSVTFAGTATDDLDGNMGASLVWTSNIDGGIGSGAQISTTTLSVGQHTITAAVIDSGGAEGSASIQVSITEAASRTITLQGTAIRAKGGARRAQLVWDGSLGPNVELYRNGVFLRLTANDNVEIDQIPGKGQGTFVYQICDLYQGGVCSNMLTLVF
jgi:extracellular elastinolytic metalloproteinase